jgi:transposase
MISVVKRATVLEEFSTEEQRSIVISLWVKGLNAKDIYKEIFPVCSGKCLSRKAVRSWVEKFPQGCSKVADDARPGAEVAEKNSQKTSMLRVCTHCKTMGHMYQGCWKICREINVFFFQVRIPHVYVLYPFVTYLLTSLV